MRKLAAILFIDVIGYSKQMRVNESATLSQVQNFSSNILRPYLAKFQGLLIKSMGDGWLVSFDSALNCVRCAAAIQTKVASIPLDFRFGINTGDVEFQDGDVFGDTANIAARLEQVSSPNQISISAGTYLCLDADLKKAFNDIGHVALKNIETPVQVWSTGALNESSASMEQQDPKARLVITPLILDKSIKSIGSMGTRLHDNLRMTLLRREWTKARMGQPRTNDYSIATKVFAKSGQACFSFSLFAPTGAVIWSKIYAFRPDNILIDQLVEEVSAQVIFGLMKFKNEF